ncbi:hypothetical protein CLV98_105200 [Dyadobacter jejuensis]|uniref:Glycosyl hydrolase family 43 n=1 Tax=Dyadobacter jejuensis TaxID=1082580 RepID=A0A316AMK2_9BACT|nr:glycoside hydrolase [Dyadobacter jejuensis]PWJ58020.1 hypothetical protein CLV98_105200 [Dyadobacter jejuensis]
MKKLIALALLAATTQSLQAQDVKPFPFKLPMEKPDQKLSTAMERLYTDYMSPTPQTNELYTEFKYTRLKGFDYNNGDGTISRRDPSKVIFVDGKYYVWYTYRHTPVPPQGAAKANDTIPSTDWDLSEIWYATSDDGFTWEEQGVAIPRPPKPQVGWRSVSTSDILVFKGKYYLYYQGFMEISGKRGDDCPVTASYADSPNGPWTPCNEIIIPNGGNDSWDQFSIHDPYPLVYKDKIYLYYKSDYNGQPNLIRSTGLATADNPLGPFTKYPLNPVINSGHETTLFPFKEGIAALVIKDGNEHNTIQYASDGANFNIAAITSLMPIAGGPYVPDAYNSEGNGRGITWGISHFTNAGSKGKQHSILGRFDCDLSLDVHDPHMKETRLEADPDFFFQHGLSKAQLERIQKANPKK